MEHRPPSHDIIHAPSLEQIGFEEYEPPEGFCPLWRSYRGEGETSGSFHILAPSDRWQIAIHDFTLLHDGDSPELRALLAGLWPRPGDEHRSQLYYEGKVFEAMGLIVERTKARRDTSGRAVAPEDRERIQAVALYIDDHCASALTVDDLARAACMSPTKFKECFKAVTGSTLTRYVQSRRISQSEGLLRMPDLSIEQVAHAVGYTCASRFSELFRRETGLLPSEYRRGLER